jgi:hypothetical protein
MAVLGAFALAETEAGGGLEVEEFAPEAAGLFDDEFVGWAGDAVLGEDGLRDVREGVVVGAARAAFGEVVASGRPDLRQGQVMVEGVEELH